MGVENTDPNNYPGKGDDNFKIDLIGSSVNPEDVYSGTDQVGEKEGGDPIEDNVEI
jgi:hypothetical protein